MSESILVGVDGSPASRWALTWAAQYGLDNQLTVIAVHVLTYSAESRHDFPPTGLTTWRASLRRQLDGEWVRPLQQSGVPYHTALVEDDSAEGGLDAAARNNAAMIVLGTHRPRLKGRTSPPAPPSATACPSGSGTR